MRRRFSATQWLDWFDQFHDSGLSIAEFCRRIGVSQNSFYVWRRKLKRGELVREQLFVPVEVTSQTIVEIQFPCGAVVRLENNAQTIRPTLEVLASLGDQA